MSKLEEELGEGGPMSLREEQEGGNWATERLYCFRWWNEEI